MMHVVRKLSRQQHTHVAMKPEMYNGCIMIIVHFVIFYIIAHSYHNYCTLFYSIQADQFKHRLLEYFS